MKDEIHKAGLRGLGTALPDQFLPLERLQLKSTAQRMAGFGFAGAFVTDDVSALALEAARRSLADAQLEPAEIGALLWASALPDAHHRRSANPSGDILDGFCYTASWLQEELGLCGATVCGVAQQGCAGMFSALRQARGLLAAEPDLQHVLCVGADALPAEGGREILYNVISDAACAVIVSRQAALLWRSYCQVSKGYYWDIPSKQSEIIAAYFPTARAAIQGALRQGRLTAGEIDLVIPTGVNAATWPILLRLCGIGEDRLFQSRQSHGHTIAADSFLVLEEARAAGALKSGMTVLLFAYGFGSSWCALILQVADSFQS